MRRREFIAVFGSAAAAWPLVARAQQSMMPMIGFLSSRSAGDSSGEVAAFRQGLTESGYEEGRNVRVEFRWAEGHFDKLSALVEELVRRPDITQTCGYVLTQAGEVSSRFHETQSAMACR
jgi:hypothetical protein